MLLTWTGLLACHLPESRLSLGKPCVAHAGLFACSTRNYG
jgi:hypothetical protein